MPIMCLIFRVLSMPAIVSIHSLTGMRQQSDCGGLTGAVGAQQTEILTNPNGSWRRFHRSDLFPFLCGRKRRLSRTSVAARTGGHVRYKSHPARAYSGITPITHPPQTPNLTHG